MTVGPVFLYWRRPFVCSWQVDGERTAWCSFRKEALKKYRTAPVSGTVLLQSDRVQFFKVFSVVAPASFANGSPGATNHIQKIGQIVNGIESEGQKLL